MPFRRIEMDFVGFHQWHFDAPRSGFQKREWGKLGILLQVLLLVIKLAGNWPERVVSNQDMIPPAVVKVLEWYYNNGGRLYGLLY